MHIRPFCEEDTDAAAAVLVRTWQAAYRGMIPDDYLNGLSIEARAERLRKQLDEEGFWQNTRILLLCDGENVVGVAGFGPYWGGDLPLGMGEIGMLYLLPAYWGRGEGSRLLNEALRHLKEQGYKRVALWMLKDNARARKAYERAGFRADGKTKVIGFGGAPVVEARYLLTFDGDAP